MYGCLYCRDCSYSVYVIVLSHRYRGQILAIGCESWVVYAEVLVIACCVNFCIGSLVV